MSERRSYKKITGPRTPPPVDSVDFNRCYIAHCANFGRYPAHDIPKWSRQDRGYIVVNNGFRSGGPSPALQCRCCGLTVRFVSNRAAVEEAARYSPSVMADDGCRNHDCENHGHPIAAHSDRYQRFGSTNGGAQRYRCRACGQTFSVNRNPYRRLRQPAKTEEVLRLLVNKAPMRRLCDVAGITAPLLYQRIGLLYNRLLAFARSREEQFLSQAQFERIRVAVDRQDHPLAWGSAIDRQAFTLKSVATADTDSGYVLAQHVNYDPDENAMQRELESRELGDLDVPAAFRQFARLWLPHEADARRQAALDRSKSQATTPGGENIGLAGRGAFVHENYSLLGHFLFLQRWFQCAARVHVSLDMDTGIDRACLLASANRVRDGSLDAFYVRINKGLSIAKRRAEIARADSLLTECRAASPELSDGQLLHKMLAERYELACQQHMDPLKRWVTHPFSTMQESNREVLCLTNNGSRAAAHVVNGLGRATLRAVDRYFMQVRRKLSVLERPIHSSSTTWRAWYGYNAYSPRVVMQLLEIFRVVYNFHLAGKDRQTPAMRLGIVAHPLTFTELIEEVRPSPPRRTKRKA